MNLLFLLGGLGVCNGFIVAIYLLSKRQKSVSDVYFAGLILALCIRIGKSVFFYFSTETDRLVLQIGLSACIFIGPFFYLYVKSLRHQEKQFKKTDITILLLLLVFIVSIGLIFPYHSYPAYWNPEIVQVIYAVWLVFFLLGMSEIRKLIGPDFLNFKKLKSEQQYLMMVAIGFTLITLTYQLALYVSFTYIWGAFIFSFFFYALTIRAIKKDKSIAPQPSPRKLSNGSDLLDRMNELMINEKLFTDQDLKLDQLASRLSISRHTLSQVMNEIYPSGYAHYIRNFRIEEAKILIQNRPELSLEGIGYEAGFKSKSVFFDSFKKIVGCTPAAYKKQLEG